MPQLRTKAPPSQKKRLRRWFHTAPQPLLLLAFLVFSVTRAAAELNQNCTVSTLNRTANVQPDGSWTLPNVPTNMGQIRARATCVVEGQTVSGQSDFFTVSQSGVTTVPEIVFDDPVLPPQSLSLTADKLELVVQGETTQLTVVATYPDGSTKDVTAGSEGTTYTVSNSATATVSQNGLVTGVSSGTVIVSASNELVLSSISLTVSLSGDSDGDGIPDDFELANGLNPNNPVDALEDPDLDGLTNKKEYDLGTNLFNSDSDGDGLEDGEEVVAGEDGYLTNPLVADSDGDGIPDGLEMAAGSNPNDSGSFDLSDIIAAVEVTPSNFVLAYNTIMPEATRQLTVTGILIDGTSLDLTSKSYGTNYSSSNLAVANFGLTDGLVFAGTDGTAVIAASNSGFTDTAVVTVSTFSPTALGYYNFPSSAFANNVDVEGQYAFVAAGAGGLYVLDVSSPESPSFITSVDTPGNANDVKISGDLALLADGPAGFQVIDISTPASPVLLGSVDTTNAYDVAHAGDYVYLADGTSGLRVLDIADPNMPVLVGTADTPGTAKGVDVDAASRIAIVADGSTGVQIVDISDPLDPQIIGAVNTNGNARDVAIRSQEALAYVADYTGGLKAIDFMTPTAPVIVKSVGDNYLTDVVVAENFAFGADVFRVNASPIYDTSVPDDPIFRAILDFSGFRDDDGTGIDVDSSYLYLTASHGITENGSAGWYTRLYVGQYRMIEDEGTVAPTVSITSPVGGEDVMEGATIPITVAASDDVAVAAVSFLVDGDVLFTDTSSPYEYSYTVPLGVTGLVISAIAIDFANNISEDEVLVNVIPDPPPTAVITNPVDGENLIEGATVTVAVDAWDNTAVTAVELLIDGTVVYVDSEAPYQYEYLVPLGNAGLSVSIGAIATDTVGNTTSVEVTNAIVPDPLTTVAGVVLKMDGTPGSGATVIVNGGLSGIAGVDGSFAIAGVPTVLGDIVATASIDVAGELFTGSSLATPPVLGGVTNVGTFVVSQEVVVADFEAGDLSGFDSFGLVSAIESIGSQVAPQGQYMAYLNTYYGSVNNRLSRMVTNQCLTVPAGMSKLVLEYNFLSWDYPPYNDAFVVIVRSSLGEQSTTLASVNANWREIMDPSTGFEWMTGFKTAEVDISGVVGGEDPCSLQIEFQVYDAIDTIVDSGVLIDNVRFE